MARRVARACGFERLKRRRTLFVRMVERTMRRIHFDAQGLSVLRGLIYERQRLLSVTRCANAIDKEGVMS